MSPKKRFTSLLIARKSFSSKRSPFPTCLIFYIVESNYEYSTKCSLTSLSWTSLLCCVLAYSVSKTYCISSFDFQSAYCLFYFINFIFGEIEKWRCRKRLNAFRIILWLKTRWFWLEKTQFKPKRSFDIKFKPFWGIQSKNKEVLVKTYKSAVLNIYLTFWCFQSAEKAIAGNRDKDKR